MKNLSKWLKAVWFKLLIIFQLQLILQLAKLFFSYSYSYSYQYFPVTVTVTVIYIFQLLYAVTILRQNISHTMMLVVTVCR